MSKISISRPSKEELKQLGVEHWSPWQCAPSEFDWQYSDDETAYVIKGLVIVTAADGERVEIKAGDLVTFPQGLKCKWKVLETVEKVYKFG
jgi:uncharacterized cupin superfamily protein